MGLKQSIVIVSEYTIKNKSGSGGSRGGTPGDYVLRYMSRKGAVEDLTPVRFVEVEDYTMRYMARKEATETAHTVAEVKHNIRDIDGYGGVAFGYGDVSLSHEKLKFASKDIQHEFDKGKTVMKTVLSFDSDYLYQNHILPEGFEFTKVGDFRGNVDQMKLRSAIMNGLDKMSKDYDDLNYVGVIQVDTKHVHCHLVLVDKGIGYLMPDDTQRGKIKQSSMRKLRRGLDTYLDEHQTVAHMSSNITHDKRNALCFIKKFTHQIMDEHGAAQFLLACLPEDKSAWRANTNRLDMKKPNAIVREYVEQVLSESDSGYRKTLMDINAYASERQSREDLSVEDYQKLLRDGKERVVQDCMNGVYAVLKQVPDSEKHIRTPMLDAMSLDYGTVAAQAGTDDFMEFGFKLRSYSSRLNHHKKEMHKYHDRKVAYDSNDKVSDSSCVMRDFYAYEEEYNAKLMCKYQYFLSFLPPNDTYTSEYLDLISYRKRMDNLQNMIQDKSFYKLKSAESAEDYGLRVYEQHGGKYVKNSPQILERRFVQMQERLVQKSDEFSYKLSDWGMTMDDKGISMKKPYEFDDVKALDIHHLAYDFHHDSPVSYFNIRNFVQVATERNEMYQNAKYYLEHTRQSHLLEQFSGRDIDMMKQTADKMSNAPVIQAVSPVASKSHGSKTVRLDRDYMSDMKFAVKSIVSSGAVYEFESENDIAVHYYESESANRYEAE